MRKKVKYIYIAIVITMASFTDAQLYFIIFNNWQAAVGKESLVPSFGTNISRITYHVVTLTCASTSVKCQSAGVNLSIVFVPGRFSRIVTKTATRK